MCTSDPNMTEHTFEEGRTKTNIRVEGRARTLYLGGKKPAEDSGTHLGSREDGDNRVKKMEGTPGLDTNATWEEEIPCLLYTSPSPRDVEESRMPSSA